jgi:membrane protease YdiL (CAAX protease family)
MITGQAKESRMPTKHGLAWIFRNRYGHFRAGWRMFFYLAITLVPYILLESILPSKKSAPGADPLISLKNFLSYGIGVVLLVLGGWVCLRGIDRRPFSLLGVNPTGYSLKCFGKGFLGGAVLLITTFVILWISGHSSIQSVSLSNLWHADFWKYFILLFLAAWVEEFFFRGYPFLAVTEGTRPWIGILFMNFLFSLGHWDNKNFIWMGSLSIFLLGLLCAVAVLKTRSLWTAAGLHLSWNWMQGPVLGMNVSGHVCRNSLLVTSPQGSDVLSGGAFGAEGSLICSIIALAGLVLVMKFDWPKPSQVLTKQWALYPAGYGMDPKGG